jgi:limonene 1,2-monooxygenase
MHLADSRDAAIANIRYGCEEFIRYFNNNQPRFDVPEGADYVDWVLEHDIAVVGTPDDAIARIERLYEKQGDFGCVLVQVTNWDDWPDTKRSFELYAHYVIPHFARANEHRVKSYNWVTANQDELVEKRVAAAQEMFAKHEAEQASKAKGGPEGFTTDASRVPG